MTQKYPNQSAILPIDPLAAAYNAFHHFIGALDVLKEPPELQCRLMGDCNTAWELQQDIAAGRHLIFKGILDRDDEDAIAVIVEGIGTLPGDILHSASGRQLNLKAMQHSAWEPLRRQAAKLRARLQPAAVRSAAYLGSSAQD